jgi:hypothetical protein
MVINIPECSHAAFVAVMEYIYTGNLPARSVLMPSDTSSSINAVNPYDPIQPEPQQQQQVNLLNTV